jgi:hypothetical protein
MAMPEQELADRFYSSGFVVIPNAVSSTVLDVISDLVDDWTPGNTRAHC